MNLRLHLISFDIPYPPNYGGVIDVFYKIKALKEIGVDVILHCFKFNKEESIALENYCQKVHYYPRNNYVKSLLSKDTPFIAKSRGNLELVANLQKDDYPILFDGLHTTYVLELGDFTHRKKFLRAHNIEHDFYKGLAQSESSIFKKRFFKKEAKKLKKYEQLLKKFDGVFSISPFEQSYFLENYGNHCHYIPAFHNSDIQTKLTNADNFVLYHGNVSVSDNVKAAFFLIDVYQNTEIKLIIASSFHNKALMNEIEKHINIEFVDISESSKLNSLFEKAQVHALPTFQKTGIKLKLLNTLYQGRFIIANDQMIDDTGLESLCLKANTADEYLRVTRELFQMTFTEQERKKRLGILGEFDPIRGAKKMVDLIFQ